jgi:hypothetical protein
VNAPITDTEIKDKMGWQFSKGAAVDILAKYGLIERGESTDEGYCWHITNRGIETLERLKNIDIGQPFISME